MSAFEEGSAFDSWYDGIVGFRMNSERMHDDLFHYSATTEDETRLRKWMKVCWNNALDAAHEYNGVDVEALKA